MTIINKGLLAAYEATLGPALNFHAWLCDRGTHVDVTEAKRRVTAQKMSYADVLACEPDVSAAWEAYGVRYASQR